MLLSLYSLLLNNSTRKYSEIKKLLWCDWSVVDGEEVVLRKGVLFLRWIRVIDVELFGIGQAEQIESDPDDSQQTQR